MTVHTLTEHAAAHGLTFATTTVIPWVQVGGAVANGCHGTGREVATVSDLVVEMEVVGPDGKLTTRRRDGSDTWRALLVNLGGLGVVYSLTFECIPMYNVRIEGRVANMPATVDDMARLYTENENLRRIARGLARREAIRGWRGRTRRARPTGR